ncbi:hypothetical protein HN873_037399, partial [Arachis hypogaea]
SSLEEESVGASKKGKNNGKKKSKVSKPVNGPVGKGNGKPKRTAIGRKEVAGASVQRKSHDGPGRPSKSDYRPAEKDKVVNGPSSGNKNNATPASANETASKSKKPTTLDEELGKKAKLEAAKEANESDKAKGVVATNEALPEGEKNNERATTNEPEAPTNATIPDVGMNVNDATGRQTQPQQPFRRPKQTIIRPKRQ